MTCGSKQYVAWIAVAALSVFGTAVASAKPQPAPLAHPRFSHEEHAAKVTSKLSTRVDCNACHKLEAKTNWEQTLPVGKAGGVHTPCSSSGCHQNTYVKFKKNRDIAFCFTCHVERLGKKLVFPPYRERGPSDFYLAQFSHKEHIREGFKGCAQCHQALKKPVPGSTKELKRVSHDRCGNIVCHGESAKPLMNACEGCHQAVVEEVTQLASFTDDPFRVESVFSHTAHAKLSPKDDCGGCHVNVGVGRGERVPLPLMVTCEKCHDGKGAFNALGATCTKCHLHPEVKAEVKK